MLTADNHIVFFATWPNIRANNVRMAMFFRQKRPKNSLTLKAQSLILAAQSLIPAAQCLTPAAQCLTPAA